MFFAAFRNAGREPRRKLILWSRVSPLRENARRSWGSEKEERYAYPSLESLKSKLVADESSFFLYPHINH